MSLLKIKVWLINTLLNKEERYAMRTPIIQHAVFESKIEDLMKEVVESYEWWKAQQDELKETEAK